MKPAIIVASLLESGPEDLGVDPKDFIATVNDPVGIDGVPIRGAYADLMARFSRFKRPQKYGPERLGRIENNTWIVHNVVSNTLSVRLHATDIITVTPEDTLTVHTGGWQTKTTLSRLNDYLPGGWGIYAQNWTWYWHVSSSQALAPDEKHRRLQPYSDGDTITADGVLHPKKSYILKRIVKRRGL